MEICKRDSEAEIIEKLTEELTNQINKRILNDIKDKFPYYYCEPEKRKIYEEKFDIKSTVDNHIPFKIQWFIYQKIEEDIHNGYIERDYKDEEGKLHTQKININDLEKIIYVYDKFYNDKAIIRIHKFKSKNKNIDGPIFAPYILSSDNDENFSNQKINSIYALTDVVFYPEMKYITFNILN